MNTTRERFVSFVTQPDLRRPQIRRLDFYKPPTKQHFLLMSSGFSTSGETTSIPHSRANRVNSQLSAGFTGITTVHRSEGKKQH